MAVVYCNRCGAENQTSRGACLRCFNPLDWEPGGVSCGACGADNAEEARHCAECSEVLVDLGPMPQCTLEGAIGLILGAEDDFASADEDEFVSGSGQEEEIAPAGVPDLDFEEEPEEIAPGAVDEPPVAPPPAPEVEEPVREEVEDLVTEVPPPPPPGADDIDLGEEDQEEAEEEELFEPAGEFAPPPPPPGADEIDLGEEGEEEESAFEPAESDDGPSFAAPAEDAMDEEPIFEAAEEPADEGAEEAADDEFSGLDFEREETPDEEPAGEEKSASDEEGDGELGGWVIDFSDDEE